MVPIIESIDENKPLEGARVVYRNAVIIVVKHPFEDKYLYLHNKKFGWNILVQGGIEDDEDPAISAVRELEEETGYFDIKKIEKMPFEMDNVFYAAHKNENRYAIIKNYYIELASLKQKEHEDDAEVLFENYEKLYDIFGPQFRHHYFLIGLATGKENLNDISEKKLGSVELVNHKVSYRPDGELKRINT